jgi:hypothetical protein
MLLSRSLLLLSRSLSRSLLTPLSIPQWRTIELRTHLRACGSIVAPTRDNNLRRQIQQYEAQVSFGCVLGLFFAVY